MPSQPHYRETIGAVIRASWFTLDPGVYAYARVAEVRHAEKHLMVIRDADETTVVTETGNLALLGEHLANPERWRLINVRCGRPFYCVGFIASIADAMAREGIDIVVTSAFTNDLVLVMENDLDRGMAVLESIGFERRDSRAA
jgi:hypothetical protein